MNLPPEPHVLSYHAPNATPHNCFRPMAGRFAGGTFNGGVVLGLCLLLWEIVRGNERGGELVILVVLAATIGAAWGALLLYVAVAVRRLIQPTLVLRPLWWGSVAGWVFIPGHYGWLFVVESFQRPLLTAVRREWIPFITLMPLVVWPVAAACFLWRRHHALME